MTMSTWALYQIVSVAVDYGKYPKKITRSVRLETITVTKDKMIQFILETLVDIVCKLFPLLRTMDVWF